MKSRVLEKLLRCRRRSFDLTNSACHSLNPSIAAITEAYPLGQVSCVFLGIRLLREVVWERQDPTSYFLRDSLTRLKCVITLIRQKASFCYRRCRQSGWWWWQRRSFRPVTDRRSMVGWRKAVVLIADGRLVVLVEMETCCSTLVRLNLANDGEQEHRGKRLRTLAAGWGSCRGRQKSRRAAWEERWENGDQAGGTSGRIKRRVDFSIGRGGDSKGGLYGDVVDESLHRVLLVVVHVEQILALASSCRPRRRIAIIVALGRRVRSRCKIEELHWLMTSGFSPRCSHTEYDHQHCRPRYGNCRRREKSQSCCGTLDVHHLPLRIVIITGCGYVFFSF